MQSNNNSDAGALIVGGLGIAFVVLKLCHVIDWSWWLVLLPFYAGLGIIAVLAIAMAVYVAWESR